MMACAATPPFTSSRAARHTFSLPPPQKSGTTTPSAGQLVVACRLHSDRAVGVGRVSACNREWESRKAGKKRAEVEGDREAGSEVVEKEEEERCARHCAASDAMADAESAEAEAEAAFIHAFNQLKVALTEEG